MVANSSALSDNVQEGVQVVSGRSNSGSFNMYGGTITGNSGGVTVGKGSTVMVSGGAKITGNTRNGSVCNVSLPNGKTITVGGKLTGGAGSIGVTTVAVPTAHTPVTIAAGTDGYALTDDDKNAFTLDSTSGGYTIAQDGNRIILSASHTHSWTYVLATTNTEHDTFTQPSGKVTVTATFMDDNTMLNYFVDVQASDYYYDAVLWAAQKGITSGTDAAHFSPNQPCTRAQIVTFLWRTVGSPVVNYAMSMDDVNEGSYYAEAVRWALSEGITGGVGDGRFDPNATCTREQAAAFLYRAAGSPAVSGGSAFSDVAANAYYADAVTWAEKNGVTGGIGGGLFGSGRDCTRAQIVTFLYRTYSK